ncbi:LysR substrate-binding domain-containing protein [Lichenibacterium ramalinae]|nr:LysR substrate-binding domain-containing protein [Lichenibacterium ramalinae]
MSTEPFDLDQMRMLSAVAAEGSFSRAAATLGVTQSAVSQGVRAVEAALGRQLLIRGGRGVEVTPDGEAYLIYARAMLKIGGDARRHFTHPKVAGVIRLGLTEDFARTVLPAVLGLFTRQHPGFSFEVECGLSKIMFDGLDGGRLDTVIAKRPAGRSGGERLWVEPFSWYGRADTPHPVPDPVDLALIPEPSESRRVMLDALRRAGRPWRAMFQSHSFATLEAAVLAGVGVTAFGRQMHGPGVAELGEDSGLPPLPALDMVMVQAARGTSDATDSFCDLVREAAILGVAPVPDQAAG